MDRHHGHIVEYVIRKNGYSLSQLALNLKINRRSIYNWFNHKELKRSQILDIGLIIRHNFSQEFPEYFVEEDFRLTYNYKSYNSPVTDEIGYKDKYISLLKKYNDLLTEKVV